MEFIATSTLNGEEVLLKELDEFHITEKKARRGKVVFQTSMENACKAAFGLRTARKVLLPLKSFDFSSKEDFYEGTKSVVWEDYMNVSKTFAVRVKGEDNILRNSAYAALLLKDAVVDRLREKLGKRPDVDKDSPNTMIQAFLADGKASISLDLGGPLHKRGYRLESTPGSINETLAASILKFCGFTGSEPFIDPMAGSGTIGIEAALIAADIAPGLLWRYERGFFSFPFISDKFKKEIVRSANERVTKPKFGIFLSDVNVQAVKTAAANAKRAGVAGFMAFRETDFFALNPSTESGLVATNMPYGDHTDPGIELTEFYKRTGDKLKRDFNGFRAGLLLGSAQLQKSVGLYAFKKISLYNGKKEVRLCLYELYEGSRKTKKEPS
jgi:putative N6-adenine-specific DNA methylase